MKENVIGQIHLIMGNVPQNTTTLEKIRWIYMKLGELFSYNYNIIDDQDVLDIAPDFDNGFMNRLETCKQISEILAMIINQEVPDTTCKVIDRVVEGRNIFGDSHVANEAKIKSTNEKYILDLTLDLYLIQSGCQTKHFGYETNIYNEYDIISSFECKEMDTKLGLIKNGRYTDELIKEAKEKIEQKDFTNSSNEEIINYVMQEVSNLIMSFKGHLEAKQYITKLFTELLPAGSFYKEYNLTYREDDNNQIVSCFEIEKEDTKKWYLYSKSTDLIETNINNINNMLRSGWKTRSDSIYDCLAEENKRSRL